MPLSLKTKFTLTTSLLVLVVVALVSWVYVTTLTRQVIRQSDDRARFVAQEVFLEAQHGLADAAARGEAPASENSGDIHEYVRQTLEDSPGLSSLMESAVGYSATIYEITISDHEDVALVSSDLSLAGHHVFERPNLAALDRSSFVQQLRILYGPSRVYEVVLPFNLGKEPFGEIRIGISSALLRDEISPGLHKAAWLALAVVLLSTIFAGAASRISLAPLARISKQLDQISAGQFDLAPVKRGDELGQVSTKINRIGQQLRDVREIFSTLRENLNQVMAGLEDGLLLFNAEGRAVLVSPSVEKFLGMKSEKLLGRRLTEIFPRGHPLQLALGIETDSLESAENVEVQLEGASGMQRVGVSAQSISEGGARMGSLLTLRDLESLDRIGSQLQVSEQLATLGRVTAGVAHEVKNPLNSMRLWLEVLKSNLPPEPEAQQAVKVLDNEIVRLDRVVKTFLDFTRPIQLQLEETDAVALLEGVLESARPAIERYGVQVVTDMPSPFPSLRLDRQLIHQAVLNLVLNGCQSMNSGGRLTLALRRTNEVAEIAVSDTGPGIVPQNRAKIFQLFFTTRQEGIGLGLANAFRFVQLHGGSIEFDTEVGRGTTFRIELPLPRSPVGGEAKYHDYREPFAQKV